MTPDDLQNIPRVALERICWGLAVRLGFHWTPQAEPEQVMDVMLEADKAQVQEFEDTPWQNPARVS